MKKAFSFFFYCFAAANICLLPHLAGAEERIPLTLKLTWSSSYQDNILKYSRRDLDRFENHTELYPSEITTADDWINTFGLRAYTDLNLGRKVKLRPYYSFRISRYSVNQIANYQSHYLLARFSHRYRVYFYLQYYYLPGYYLRVYKDRNLDEYHSCDFDLHRPTARLRYRLPPYEIEGGFGREYIYYNGYFTEYDSEANFYNLEGSYTTPFNLDISLGYEYKESDNVGFVADEQMASSSPIEDTEYGDSSYEENRFNVTALYPLPIESSLNWQLGIEFERRLRYYQSSLPLNQDPFHAGRKDRRDIIATKVSLSATKAVSLEFKFTYDLRRTESPESVVRDIKNYDRRTFELNVVYQVF